MAHPSGQSVSPLDRTDLEEPLIGSLLDIARHEPIEGLQRGAMESSSFRHVKRYNHF